MQPKSAERESLVWPSCVLVFCQQRANVPLFILPFFVFVLFQQLWYSMLFDVSKWCTSTFFPSSIFGGEGWWGVAGGAWLAVVAAKYGGNAHSVQGETKQLMLRKLKTFSLKWSRSWRNDFAWDCHHRLISGVIFSFQLGRFLYTFLFLRRTGFVYSLSLLPP